MAAKSTTPKAPAHLGKDGKQLWKDIHEELPTGWTFDRRERAVLRLACEQLDDLVGIRAALAEQGMTVEGSRGQDTMNRLLTEARQSRASISRLLGTLALPSATDEPMTTRQIQGAEAAKKRKAMADSWKARQEQARGRSDG